MPSVCWVLESWTYEAPAASLVISSQDLAEPSLATCCGPVLLKHVTGAWKELV